MQLDQNTIDSIQNQQTVIRSTRDLEVLKTSMSKVRKWINSSKGLTFFTPLCLSIPVEFKEKEYMLGRFGGDGIVITDTNRIFFGIDFTLDLTLVQQAYLLLNGLLQVTHLFPHRLPKLIREDAQDVDIKVKEACAGIAAMCFTNSELTSFLPRYHTVLQGCNHVIADVNNENYWKFLGWEKKEDVPAPIRDINSLLDGVVERMAVLFIKYHNPNNPPRNPDPLWGEGTPDEKGDRDSQAFKNEAKMLTRKAIQAAQAAKSKEGGNVFCPFKLDDLHVLEATPISYKDIIDTMVVQSHDDWGGFDRRNLGTGINVDYNYTMNNENVNCVIYCDTSGSLVGNVKDVLKEVYSIVCASSNTKVLVKYFSTEVEQSKEETWITADTPIDNWNFPSVTGGTCFQPIKEDIEEYYSNSNVVVITDGYFFDPIEEIHTSGKILLVMTQEYNDKVDWDVIGQVAFCDIA